MDDKPLTAESWLTKQNSITNQSIIVMKLKNKEEIKARKSQVLEPDTVINVKTLDGKIISLTVNLEQTVRELKVAIQEETGMPTGNQKLIHETEELKDNKAKLMDCRIKAESTIELISPTAAYTFETDMNKKYEEQLEKERKDKLM